MTTALFIIAAFAVGFMLGDLHGYEKGWGAAWKKFKEQDKET